MKSIFSKAWLVRFAIFSFFSATLFALFYLIMTTKVQQQIAADQELINTTYEFFIRNEANIAKIFFERYIDSEKVKSVLYHAYHSSNSDKNALREELLQLLNEEYLYRAVTTNLKQLHFHEPDNHSFLRFHRPTKFGDDLTQVRATVAYVNEHKTSVQSFEEGRIFNGYRFVFPLFYQGSHIGSVETSVSMKAILYALKEMMQAQTVFLMKKEVVDKKVFPEERANYMDAYISSDYVVEKAINHNHELVHKSFDRRHLNIEHYQQAFAKGEFFSDFSHFDGLFLLTHYFPIINDVTKQHVGYVVIVRKHLPLRDSFEQLLALLVAGHFLILFVMFAFERFRSINKSLEVKSSLLEEVQSIARVGTWEFDFKSKILSWSRQTFHIFNMQPSHKISFEKFMKAVHPQDVERVGQEFQLAISNKEDYTIKHRILLPSGETRYLTEHGHLILNRDQEIERIIGITQDLSEYSKLINQLSSFLDNQSNMMIVIDNYQVVFTNQAFVKFIGSDMPELYEKPNLLLTRFLHMDGFDFYQENSHQVWLSFIDSSEKNNYQVAMNDSQGIRHAFKVNINRLEQNLRVLSFHDMTETIQEVIHLKDKLVHDQLTEAFNREYLARFMQKIRFDQTNKIYGMALLDIDFFKKINDEAGHLVGDKVLKELVRMLNTKIRKEDFLIRWGGEEFIVVFQNITIEELAQTSEYLRLAISEHDFGIKQQPVTCSFGVTLFNNQEMLDTIIHRADQALYKAKNNGRNMVEFAE